MKKFNLTASLMLLVFALFLASCSDNTTNPVDSKPAAVKGLMATSLDNTTIRLLWTEPTDTYTGFTLDITPGAIAQKTFAKGVTTTDVSGLIEGTVYTFKLKAVNGTASSDSVTILWSPATRFTKNINDDFIKVYETASTFGSGLQFYNVAGNAPKVLKISNGADWNFGLYSKSAGTTFVGSPSKLTYSYTGGTPKLTEISTDYFETNDLNTVFDSQALNADPSKFSEMSIDLETLGATTGVVLICRTKDNGTDWNYAKVFIKKTGGTFLQGTADNRYIEVQVSYQKVVNVPYAK